MTPWTRDQQAAVGHVGGEAVVSASAGSGKTAVLIERAVRLVVSGRAGVEELLLVTFTNDAAEELRLRLRGALDAAVRTSPAGRRAGLLRQLRRLDRARIGTIHGFCLQVLRDYHHLLGLGAEPRVLSAEEAALLHDRVLEELFETNYGRDDAAGAAFRRLVDLYGGPGVDKGLAEAVRRCQHFLETLVDPAEWLARSRRAYSPGPEGEEFRRGCLAQLQEHWLGELRLVLAQFAVLREEAAAVPDARFAAHYADWHRHVQAALADMTAGRWAEAGERLGSASFRAPSVQRDAPYRSLVERINQDRNGLKESLRALGEEITQTVSPTAAERLAAQAAPAGAFLDLVEAYRARLAEAKGELGALEFDDLQRQAWRLLSADGGARPEWAEAAERYRREFRFVMVDEFQDVSELQDALVRAVCRRDAAGRCVNLLVVGDVKQSIYRFRSAYPEILQRLCRRADDAGGGLARYNLAVNFRSRREVLEAANFVFGRVLAGGPLELVYDERERLVPGAEYPAARTDSRTELYLLDRDLEPAEAEDGGEPGEVTWADLERFRREAYLIADRIRSLLDDKMTVTEGGRPRPVRAEDVVVLLRSPRHAARVVIDMLRGRGLAAYSADVQAFLEYPEIADLVAVLRVIDNPYQDIPLAAVLRGPLVRLTDAELARIRRVAGGGFYRAVRAFAESAGSDGASGRVREFLDRLAEFRGEAANSTVGDLVEYVCRRTG